MAGKMIMAVQLREILQQLDAGGLALFGMKLRAGDILIAHHGGQRPAIIGGGDQIVGQGGLQLKAMDEIGMGAGGNAFQQRRGSASIFSSFQPMCGIFSSGSDRA